MKQTKRILYLIQTRYIRGIINHKSIKMKKIILVLILVVPTLIFAQKSAGTLSQEDDLSKITMALGPDYASNSHSLWNEKLSDNAIVRVNNTVMDGKSVKEIWKSHHTIFNNIEIKDSYAHTNYFKSGDTWTNNWFTWEGTGNKTGIRTSNRTHFAFKWEKGKIIEMNCYFDTTSLSMELAAQ